MDRYKLASNKKNIDYRDAEAQSTIALLGGGQGVGRRPALRPKRWVRIVEQKIVAQKGEIENELKQDNRCWLSVDGNPEFGKGGKTVAIVDSWSGILDLYHSDLSTPPRKLQDEVIACIKLNVIQVESEAVVRLGTSDYDFRPVYLAIYNYQRKSQRVEHGDLNLENILLDTSQRSERTEIEYIPIQQTTNNKQNNPNNLGSSSSTLILHEPIVKVDGVSRRNKSTNISQLGSAQRRFNCVLEMQCLDTRLITKMERQKQDVYYLRGSTAGSAIGKLDIQRTMAQRRKSKHLHGLASLLVVNGERWVTSEMAGCSIS